MGGKPTQDNSLRNYRHQLSWLCLERRNLLTTLLKAGRDKNNKMKTRLALDKNEKTFELLGEYIPGYNKNRALNGIGLKLKTEDDCIKYTAELKVALAKAELEFTNIKKLEKYYNTTFPSDNKNCLSTPHYLYNKIKCSISEIKKSILKFCPRNNRRAAGSYSSATQTMNVSHLCNKTPYAEDMYPEVYPDYVHQMLDVLERYMKKVAEIIQLCQELMNEENEIRNNDEYLKEIEASCRVDLEETAYLIKNVGLLTAQNITKEDLERRRKEAKDMNQLRRILYHNISRNDYKIQVFKDVIMKGLSNDLTPEESEIWTNQEDYGFVKHQVRSAIEGMKVRDDLPSIKQRKSEMRALKAEYVACFMLWCRVPKSHHRLFLAYLERQFVGAPLRIPNYKSVMGVKTSKMDKNRKQDYFADFKSYSAD